VSDGEVEPVQDPAAAAVDDEGVDLDQTIHHMMNYV
jgi:hypothetical protein